MSSAHLDTTRIAAVIAAVLFAILVLFQLALALGAPWGRAAYGGQTVELGASLRVTSAIAVVIWSGIALIVLRHAGFRIWAPLPASWSGVAIWVIVGLLAIAVIPNAITLSALERAIWLPISLLLLGSTLTVAIARR